jgi:hypothetical protein
MNPFPPSWPVAVSAYDGTVPDYAVLRQTLANGPLPDPSWVPLTAAALSVASLDAATRKSATKLLSSHAPGASGFGKPLKPNKAWESAVAAQLDLDLFAHALLLLAPGAAMATVLKRHSPEVAFHARAGHHNVEHRLTSKTVPPGLGALSSLRRLTLLSPQKLKSGTHLDELARSSRPIALTLAFDGTPDVMGADGSFFVPPPLDLLTPGAFGALSFETTGSWVRMDMDRLRPLADWSRLEVLVLTSTLLSNPDATALAWLKQHVPQLKRLVLPSAPSDTSAWSELEIVAHAAWVQSPDPWRTIR